MNTLSNYMTLANRTNKDGDSIQAKPEVYNAIVTNLPQIIKAADTADRLKAAFCYGEKLRDTGTIPKGHLQINPTGSQKEQIHALLGLVSEAGELAEAFYSSIINDEPLDENNIIEECGDILWFLALMVKNMNIDLNKLAEINIAKLKERYPDKYSDIDAVQRNVEAEYDVISKNL